MTPKVWLARETRAVAGGLRLAALYGVLEGLLIIAQAGLIAWLVHQVIMREQMLASLAMPAGLLFLVVLLRPVFQILRARTAIAAAATVQGRVRERLLGRAEALGPTGLATRDTGELASQLTDQVNALEGYYARYLPQMTVATLVPLAIVIAAFTQDWIAAGFLLLSAPLIPLFMALVGMGAERLNRDQFEALGRLSGQFLDRVRGLTTLQLFGRIPGATRGIIAGSDEYRERSMRVLRVAFLSSAVLEFFASVAIAVVAIYVGFGLLGYIEYGPASALTLFSGLFVLLLAPEFFQPLRTLAQHYHDRATALGAAELLADFESEDVAVSNATQTLAHNAPTLTAESVELARPGRGTVLRVPSLTATAGERVLIEGPSGSGKTTLLLALPGMLQPSTGHIVRALPDTRIGWLGAPAFLASASLRENIGLGDPTAEAPAIEAAARRAGVSDFADQLPDGLDTHVGERGLGLSGGQAQRVALARAFVSPASLILLDEPTAALDAETETFVIRGLAELAAEGRIILIASHDTALRSIAERRYVIRDGVLERVTHA
ncbi:thiol reductant ABC exporter subunit CydD [Spiribacter salinus]|uniref:thiol reductant ABC exporter subunit CydD n=1 Tax=Spiribacter salinus TaxID=1335746 RepID=UPI001C95768F|nr:thiol reductant ABC exporter subunit CydD [Spiribacter salinus]MBY5268518.1 thiol reductant ABC exporter subunit CydD [Spiribacter salinus]